MSVKYCFKCGKSFAVRGRNQRFCGNVRRKEGCSYENYKERSRKYISIYNKKLRNFYQKNKTNPKKP